MAGVTQLQLRTDGKLQPSQLTTAHTVSVLPGPAGLSGLVSYTCALVSQITTFLTRYLHTSGFSLGK